MSAHCVSTALDGDGPGLDFDDAEGNRALRAGISTVAKVCLMLDEAGRVELAASIKDTNLFETVSRSGTWVKSIGSVDTESRAGRDFCVWGCAVR